MWETPVIVTLILFNVIFIAFIGGIIIFIKQYRLKKRIHQQIIISKDEDHKQELLETQMEIQTHTMQYIGREIHDNVGQKLTLASLLAQQMLFNEDRYIKHDEIRKVNTIIDESLKELRLLSKSLTNDSIKINSLERLILSECKRVNDSGFCKMEFIVPKANYSLSYSKKSVVYRIFQEFIQNSLKHSKCSSIVVRLTNLTENFKLEIEDNGIGFNMERSDFKGIGIQNMRKRADLINGEIIFISVLNKGTKLTLIFPYI
ncbi:sensor histidine kinase [Aquimarina algiphila]|uniref:histidine kinase n=1 Tax=Aquimarina algiphila TaxID=2047982 RepID=A0A554VJA8_9FLAO|nr:ATP-binding protein [Aquimarina algiphila]TSE07991.1 two-component sensor histidine kinase [Aquimarina algiphila]